MLLAIAAVQTRLVHVTLEIHRLVIVTALQAKYVIGRQIIVTLRSIGFIWIVILEVRME